MGCADGEVSTEYTVLRAHACETPTLYCVLRTWYCACRMSRNYGNSIIDWLLTIAQSSGKVWKAWMSSFRVRTSTLM